MKINCMISNFIFFTAISCYFCPYFLEPDLSKDAMGPMLTCIEDDFISSRFLQFKLKDEEISELVVLIDVISVDEYSITTIKRNSKGRIETKTHKYLFSFEDSICDIIKRNYSKDKCDIYFYHFNLDLPTPIPQPVDYRKISRDRFSSIQSKIIRMGHKIQLLPKDLKILSKNKSKNFKYFHFYWKKADYIVPLVAKENSENFLKFFDILEEHKERKLDFLKNYFPSSLKIDLLSNFAINEIYDAIILREKVNGKDYAFSPLELNEIMLILRSTINLFKISKQALKNLEIEFGKFSAGKKLEYRNMFDDCKFDIFTLSHTIDPFFFPQIVDIPNLCVFAQCCESIYKSFDQGILHLDLLLLKNYKFIRFIFLLITFDIKKLVENIIELEKDKHDLKTFYCLKYKKYWFETFKNWLGKNNSILFESQEDNFRTVHEKFIKDFDTTPSRNIFEYSQLLREYLLGDFYY